MKEEMEIEKIYPLSPMQKGMLFHYLKDEKSRAYSELRYFTLEGEIDPGCLERSIRYLVERYDVLRTVFSYEKVKEPLQIVFKNRNFNLQYEDISMKPREEQEKYLEDIKESQGQKGFDLRKDLLIRVFLFKTAASAWKLLWTYHHIIIDGWCAAVIFNQSMQVYNAIKHDRPVQLKPAVPYREYIHWLKKQDPGQGLLYWREYLDGNDRQAGLPGPCKPPPPHRYRLKEHRFIIPTNLENRVNQLAIKHQATLFTVIQTTWGILLQKYNDTDDVVFGIVVSGRPPDIKGIGEMVGLFVNTIPMRIQTKGKQEFRQLLEQVQQETLSSRTYEYLPLAEVQSQSALKEHLIDHIMVYENYPQPGRQEGGSTDIETDFQVTHMDTRQQTSYDLNVLVIPDKDLTVVFNYNADVYETGILEKAANRYLNLLNEVTKNPDREISKIEIITAEEKEQIVLKFNDTRQENPRDKTIHALYAEQVERTPDHVALTGPKLQITNYKSQTNYKIQITNKEVPPGEITNYKLQITNKEVPFGQILNAFGEMGGPGDDSAIPVLPVQPVQPVRPFRPVQLTYRELNARSDGLAYKLLEQGVKPETIAAIMVERSIGMIIGILGILKAGGAYMPIDPAYPKDRIDYMLKDSNAQVLLVDDISCASGLSFAPEALLNLSEGRPFTHHSSFIIHHSSNLAYVIYTSGSTGKPKGVMVEHVPVVNILMAMQQNYPLGESGTYLLKTSYVFDVSVMELFGWIPGGGRLAILEKEGEKDPARILEAIEKSRVTHIDFVPSMFRIFTEELSPTEISKLSSLKYIFLAAETLTPGLVKEFQGKKTGIALENLYGPTEATVYASMYSLTQWEGGSIPIGKPLQNIRLYILSKDNHIQPIGVPGELCIGGIGLARGYLNKPELTAEKFIMPSATKNPFEKGFLDFPKLLSNLRSHHSPLTTHHSPIYRTGDLASWQPDGNILFLGRIDFQVKIRGNRIELGEIETRLKNHESIKDAVVAARQEQDGDKYLCAYIVPHQPGLVLNSAAIREYLQQYMPQYMIPSYFEQLERMPLTPNGKLDRSALPEPTIPGQNLQTLPQSEIEKQLAALWAEILNIKKDVPGIDSNFFHLGGQSLKAMKLVSHIHKRLNVEITLAEIFTRPTIRTQAELIKNRQKNIHTAITTIEKKEYYPVSSAQKRMFIMHRMEGNETGDNTPVAYLLEGKFDINRIQEAIHILIRRHEPLRTSFEIIYGEPVQRIHTDPGFEIENKEIPAGEDEIEAAVSLIHNLIRPFDLGKPPLLRAALVKMPGDRYILFHDMHHIIRDGTSSIIFLDEIIKLYKGEKLPPLRIQYKDFAAWQNNRQQSEMIKKQERYWQEVYAGDIPVLNMPIDYPRPAVRSFAGAVKEFTLTPAVSREIGKITLETGTTLYMVLLALCTLLLSRYSGQEDIIIGTPTAGRPHAELENLMGMFVNTLAVRNFPRPGRTFREFLEEVKANTLKAFENQDYQFEDLVSSLGIKPNPARQALFDIMLAVQNMDRVKRENNTGSPGKELSIKPFKFGERDTQFDIMIHAFEIGEIIAIKLLYCTRLFKEETIGMLIENLREIAAAVTENMDLRLRDIRISHGLSHPELELPREDFVF